MPLSRYDAKRQTTLMTTLVLALQFASPQQCEAAYFKMENVLIDDRRIHVDFSQSVTSLHNVCRIDRLKVGAAQVAKGGRFRMPSRLQGRNVRAPHSRSATLAAAGVV